MGSTSGSELIRHPSGEVCWASACPGLCAIAGMSLVDRTNRELVAVSALRAWTAPIAAVISGTCERQCAVAVTFLCKMTELFESSWVQLQ